MMFLRHAAAGQPSRRAPGDISLGAMISTLWHGMWLLLGVVVLSVVVAAAFLKTSSPLYRASMVVAPAEHDLGAASRLAIQIEEYADLATLAQTPQKVEHTSPMERYLQILRSVEVAERLESNYDVLRRVYPDQWDPQQGAWRPPGALATMIGHVQAFFGYPSWEPPNVLTFANYLQARIELGRVSDTALRRLTLVHRDGALAVELLGLAHEAADDLLRQDALARARDQVRYLEAELEDATRPERQAALRALLAEQYRAAALLDLDGPFAAEVVSPPTPSATPISASPVMVLALAGVVGLILGVLLVFLRDALRSG